LTLVGSILAAWDSSSTSSWLSSSRCSADVGVSPSIEFGQASGGACGPDPLGLVPLCDSDSRSGRPRRPDEVRTPEPRDVSLVFVGGSFHQRGPLAGGLCVLAGQWTSFLSGRRDSNPRPPPWQLGGGCLMRLRRSQQCARAARSWRSCLIRLSRVVALNDFSFDAASNTNIA
jgi:hypothetical protein